MKTQTIVKTLKFWTLFIGIGALVGALMMWTDPSGKMWGMDPLLIDLQSSMPFPNVFFRNFVISGFVLLAVNGITQGTAYYLLCRKHHYAALATLICGVILIAWIVLEWFIFGFNFMSNIYFVFGVLEALSAAYLLTKKEN